jgi:hypothetical protein
LAPATALTRRCHSWLLVLDFSGVGISTKIAEVPASGFVEISFVSMGRLFRIGAACSSGSECQSGESARVTDVATAVEITQGNKSKTRFMELLNYNV